MPNPYEYPMYGLDEASDTTAHCPQNSTGYTHISYNTATGAVLTSEHADPDSWTRYPDQAIITVCGAYRSMSAQEIAEKIVSCMNQRKQRMMGQGA